MRNIPEDLSVWIGVPGSGKTTTASWAVWKINHDKRYSHLKAYTNFACIDAYKIDSKKDLGTYMVSDGLVIVDEAGIDFSNRSWKTNLTPETNRFNRKFRHYRIEHYMFFSQFLDMDNTFIKLARSLHMCKKIGPFIIVNDYKKLITFNEDQVPTFAWRQASILEGGTHIIYAPKYYPYFDSWEIDDLPEKEFSLWQDEQEFPQYDYVNRTLKRDSMCSRYIKEENDIIHCISRYA